MHRFYQWGVVVTLACLLLTAFPYPTLRASQGDPHETDIPFTLTTSNNIVIRAVINHKDIVKLMLHPAASDVTLTEDAVRKAKNIKFTCRNSVKSWGGEAASRFSKGNQVQMGPLQRNYIADSNSSIWLLCSNWERVVVGLEVLVPVDRAALYQ